MRRLPDFPARRTRRSIWCFADAPAVTADQTSAVFAQLGGDGDADTQQNITQYFSTVPAQDVEVALRLYAGCMQKVDDDQAQWDAGARRNRAGSRPRSLQSHLQFPHAPESGSVRGHSLCHRRSGHQGLFRCDHRRKCSPIFTTNGTDRITPFWWWWATSTRTPPSRPSRHIYGSIPKRAMPRASQGRAAAGEGGVLHRLTAICRTRSRFWRTVFREPTVRITPPHGFWRMLWPASAGTCTRWFRKARLWRRSSDSRNRIPKPASVTHWAHCRPVRIPLPS